MHQDERQVFEARNTLEQWDRDYYHPIAVAYYDDAVPRMIELMGAKPGANILDAGCGPGVHSIRVARAGYHVYGIDRSLTMLEEARSRISSAGFGDRVELAQEDLTRLSFAEAAFDYVFSWGVIIHIPEVEKALAELARIVRPGGKLALYVTNQAALDHKIERLARRLLRRPLIGMERRTMGDGCWYEMNGERLWLWRIDVGALCRYLEARGFRLRHHLIGEFTNIQRRTHGTLRSLLLRLNNLLYRLRFPPTHAAATLLVFEKTD